MAASLDFRGPHSGCKEDALAQFLRALSSCLYRTLYQLL
jgi:hypothetical protein